MNTLIDILRCIPYMVFYSPYQEYYVVSWQKK